MKINCIKNDIQGVRIEKDCEFVSHCDGLKIKYDVYVDSDISESCLRGVIQIAHGMVEHKERYEWVGKSLAKKGYIVAINDHRGHGKSIDSAHPWGEMRGDTEVDSRADSSVDSGLDSRADSGFVRAVRDMHQLTGILKARFGLGSDSCSESNLKSHSKPHSESRSESNSESSAPNASPSTSIHTSPHASKLKFILLGHSMGSLLARGYLLKYAYELDGLILSGSPAHNPLAKLGALLARGLKAMGARERGRDFINALSFGGFNKPFLHNEGEDNTKGGFAWLCRDKAVVEAYKADRACQFVFSLESFAGLFLGMAWVNDTRADFYGSESSMAYSADSKQDCEKFSESRDAVSLPLFIISGDRDSCGGFGTGVEKIARLYAQWGFDVRLKLYSGARHEILNETNKQEVLEDIAAFIETCHA